ncbi:DUF4365 domain-containing protein [Agrobacterium tumefaciens]|uniref:DUF4365 domain-containing protein n=1 Tax=Agrobacterium tumefaciens TaxID=358 RepID=UPI0021D21902|nr:DUF4365 domain-containing protein [Agrobacterium tumefaciens]UXS26952.1 DUF4365 domain-containing protein [Agrobacterium tumefaciens]UXS54549.1 DUF4365 domain-containing protein [Agrobacterium tumefaciens]UXS65478.1 DUF4365 domain-containing protein [Agrobacterium tumefaciens]
MITIQHTQESLSRAYVHAVAGSAGVNCSIDRAFDYGIDGTFRPVAIRGNRRIENGFALDYQLKCTTNWQHEGTNVSYSIKTKTYNDLVTRDPEGLGVVLLLLCVPTEENQWAEFTEDFLTLRRCCYYTVLSGSPVENEESTRKILIPRSNVLTAQTLNQLLAEERQRKMGGAA